MQNDDRKYVRRAIALAKRGRGATSPNPLVGAVVVNGGVIVGEGYHGAPGADHAEIVALKSAGEKAAGSTLYVNLEPCAHRGRTPPCTEAIVQMGIQRVVTSVADPNPMVNGRGFEELRRGGISIETGILAREAEKLNEAYFAFMRTGRPFVTLKLAQTLDGRIADNEGRSRWISSEKSRRYVHRLRSETDAVMVGIGTIVKDDPALDVRHVRGRSPVKVVVDSRLRIPLNSRVFDGARVIVAGGVEVSRKKRQDLEMRGAEVWVLPGREGIVDLRELMERLAAESIVSVLVEGGSRLAASLLREKLVNRVLIFIAPGFIGRGLSAIEGVIVDKRESELAALWLSEVQVRRIGEDILYSGYPRYE